MVPTMLKRVVMCAALAVWMLGLPGCVKQSDFDAKVLEAKNQAEKVVQLQKDFDAAKGEVEKLGQSQKDAEAKIKTLEQENADLRKQIPKPAAPKK